MRNAPALPPPPCTPETADDFLSAPSPELKHELGSWRQRVLVLGAGGKMGLHLCLMLHRAAPAATITAVSRFSSHRDRETFHQHGIETLPCDLSDAGAVAALPASPLVFFLAGVKFGTASDPELLHRMNVLAPRLVAERYRGSTIVAFSTGCVYPFVPVTSSGATEHTPPEPVGAYALSCRQREEEFARVAAQDPSTRVVLIRLNYSVEFRYGVLVDIARRVLAEEPVDVTMGHVNVIWQRDAIETILRAHAVAANAAQPLNVTGAAVLRVRDLAEDFGRLFGVTPRFTGTEAPTAWLNDASFAHQRWGVPPTSLETMEQWVASWLAAGYPTWGKPTGFEKRDGQF